MAEQQSEVTVKRTGPGEPHIRDTISRESGTEITPCYQCQKCSTGCPVAYAMDILPHQIIRMMQLGLLEEALASKTIWVCASCYTCGTRCPNDVDIAKVMDALRRRSLKAGISPGEKGTPPFHAAFLNSIKSLGRVHELGMVQQYKMKSGGMFKDIRGFINDAKLGWKLFRKGKLKISSEKINGIDSIREIFRKAEP